MAANNRYGISDTSGSAELKTVRVNIPQSGWVDKTYTVTNASSLGFPTVETQISISPTFETRENVKQFISYEILAEQDISNNQIVITCETVPILALSLKFQWTELSGDGGSENIELSNSLPIINGTASAGTSDQASRADHIHPTDTNRAPYLHSAILPTYGAGNATNYGHVKLSDAIDLDSKVTDGAAATPYAILLTNNKIATVSNTADEALSAAESAQQTASNAQSTATSAQSAANAAVKTVNNVSPNAAGNVTIVVPTFTVQDYVVNPSFTSVQTGQPRGTFSVRYRILSQNGTPIAVLPFNVETDLLNNSVKWGGSFNIPGTEFFAADRTFYAHYTCPSTALIGGLVTLNAVCKMNGFLELKNSVWAPVSAVFIPYNPKDGLSNLSFHIGAVNNGADTIVGTSDTYQMNFQGITY